MGLQRHSGIGELQGREKQRVGKYRGRAVLQVNEKIEWMELCCRVGDEELKSLWVRIKGQP